MSVVIVDACTKEQAAHYALRLLQFLTLLFIFVLLIPFFPFFYWFSSFPSYALLCFIPNLARPLRLSAASRLSPRVSQRGWDNTD